ncbi:Na+/H+ antiporter [Eggerthellaceae bacterium 3-80]|nr:Na+/H+ antiporter [bacterium D16-34]
MELFELVLLLLGAVLLSTVFAEMIPRVSLPLVQIALGAVAALFWAHPTDIQVDPELFLVLFIAPLLFDESRHANRRALWRNRSAILSLAIGLVIATVLVVGFTLNWLVPSIPLAAAFALGAALGPTDAVAVTALSKDIKLNPRQQALLSGEALINDASGVVSFQFAIAAAVTGTFSLVDASVSFLISFFGGILLGLALGFVAVVLLRFLRSQGLESTTTHVVFEVFIPFVVFLLAEHAGTSGILAVVAAGLLMTFYPQKNSSDAGELKVVSSSVWDVLVFVINGVVFVLLGMELMLFVSPTLGTSGMSRSLLLGSVLLVTFLVLAIRFIWIFVMDALKKTSDGKRLGFKGHVAKDALVTTLAGPKGAVTLSIAFTIPYDISAGVAFPHRNDLIFLASGVIVVTLLLANFIVPLLAPKEAENASKSREVELTILRAVVKKLQDQLDDQNPDLAITAVIRNYEERIANILRGEVDSELLRKLRIEVVTHQILYVDEVIDSHVYDPSVCERYLNKLMRVRRRLQGRRGEKYALKPRYRIKTGNIARYSIQRAFKKAELLADEQSDRRSLMEGAEQVAIVYLKGIHTRDDKERARAVRYLLSEHCSMLRMLRAADSAANAAQESEVLGTDAITFFPQYDPAHLRHHIDEVEAEGLRFELGQIQAMQDEGSISRKFARELREQVYIRQMALSE